MDFRILGRPDVYHEGERVDIGAPKQRTVLAALLLSTNEALSTDRLMDSVWSRPPAAANANLRVYLSGLRRVLHVPGERGSRLRTVRAGGYRLSVHPGELDLQRFDALADRGEEALRAGQLPTAADRLECALRLWHGRALDGVAYGPALEAIVQRLEERRLAVAELWARARLDLGQPESVVTELQALVKEHPLRERLWGHLMRALCQSGRPGEALAAYAELRTVLAGELGVDPGPELRRLYERILHSDETLARPAAGLDTPATPVAPPRQLPAGPRALCGRTEELDWLRRTLSGAGDSAGPVVVAIDGVAGVGKSALALAAAQESAEGFPDGQFYVDLQGATPGVEPLRPADVLAAFLRTLGVRPASVPADEAEAAALFRSLVAQRRILVLLDDAASLAQIRPLLPGGSGCAAVVTSRGVLPGLAEAVRMPLGLLSLTGATTLLEQLAGASRVGADPDAAGRLAALCGHLPLALRIAGARLATRPGWPLAALADRLAAAQHRLDELAVADLAVRTSIDLTYRGLSEPAQLALRRLGLLRSWDFPSWALAALLDAPPAYAERVLDDLAAVHLVETESATRYRFHDLVRLYAQEQAATVDPPHARAAAVRRLAGACLTLAERADTRLSADFLGASRHRMPRWSLPRDEVERITAEPRDWFKREHGFLIAVVDSGLDCGVTDLAGCLAAALTTFFQVGTHFDDWRRVQTRALAAAARAGDRRTAAKLHRSLGELDTIQDRYDDAIDHFEAAQSARTERDPEYDTAVTSGLGYLYRLRGRYEEALRSFGRAWTLARTSGNLNGLVYATNGIGVVNLERGRLAEAEEHFDECLRLSQQAGYHPGVAQAMRALGHVRRAQHRYTEAAVHFRQAVETSESLGDRLGAAHAACWLGEMLIRQGQHGEARQILTRCLWVHRDFANAWGEAGALWVLAVAQFAVGRPRAGLHRVNQAIAIWRRLDSPFWLAVALETLSEMHHALNDRESSEAAYQESTTLRQTLGLPPR